MSVFNLILFCDDVWCVVYSDFSRADSNASYVRHGSPSLQSALERRSVARHQIHIKLVANRNPKTKTLQNSCNSFPPIAKPSPNSQTRLAGIQKFLNTGLKGANKNRSS